MQPQPVFTITGVVAAVRPTVIPARPATESKPATREVRFCEVDVLAEESLLDGSVMDFPSAFTARVPHEAASTYGKGQVFDEKCTAAIVLCGRPGKWWNEIRFRPVRFAESASATAAA